MRAIAKNERQQIITRGLLYQELTLTGRELDQVPNEGLALVNDAQAEFEVHHRRVLKLNRLIARHGRHFWLSNRPEVLLCFKLRKADLVNIQLSEHYHNSGELLNHLGGIRNG